MSTYTETSSNYEDLEGMSVKELLENINKEDRPEQVIGGYVAHDSAFAAAREGAEVTLTSLFAREEMTATDHEVEDALREGVSIHNGVMPLEVILVPIFFILMGIQVKLESFMSWPVLVVAGGLLVAALIGKLLCGLGARKPVNKLVVGLGMVPRGEVGLVFAAIGRSLGVIDDAIFSAIVLMVIITTLVAPPLLKMAVHNHRHNSVDA